MKGTRSGVATKILQLESKALTVYSRELPELGSV